MGIKGKNDKMVVLACEDCKERNYTTTKNKKTNKLAVAVEMLWLIKDNNSVFIL